METKRKSVIPSKIQRASSMNVPAEPNDKRRGSGSSTGSIEGKKTGGDSPKRASIFKDLGKVNMGSFLNDLKDFSEQENDKTKEILKKLDMEKKELKSKDKTDPEPNMNIANVMYSKKEIKEFTEHYNENISKFYTYSQSGKEFLHKNLSKGMKEL